MIYEIECESKKGNSPKRFIRENQDAFYSRQNEKWCCLCIADGAGSKKHSSLGAKWLTYDISKFFLDNADELIENEERTIRSEIKKCINHSLNKTMQIQNVEYSELSSTLLGILTDGRRCLLLHIGDGVILAVREGYLNVLSFPMNGNSSKTTALTTMDSLEQHLRIKKITCDSISILWLMTDGAMYEIFQENFDLNGEILSMPMIRTKLSGRNIDDATYGYIKWRG